MKVKCTTKSFYFLTYGKVYDVIHKEDDKYYVNDDEGDEVYLRYYDECKVVDEDVQKLTQEVTVEPTKEFKVGDKWWYPSESLELVEEAKQDEIKEELVQCNEAFEDYSGNSPPVIANTPLVDHITYQEFLDAFDYDDSPYIEINKEQVVIGVVDNRLECTTKQREQEVMKALIVLYGKREGENRWLEK